MSRIKNKIVDDWGTIYKRWSTQIITLMIVAQSTWALVPSEAREILPRPELISIGLGIAALIASLIKQGREDE